MPKPSAIKERDVLLESKALLDFFKYKGLLDYWRISTGGILHKGGYLVPNREMIGFSDIIILIRGIPYCVFLELKAEKGRQSPNQKSFQSRVEATGHKYYLCRSRSELCEILELNGVPVKTFIK